MKHTKRIGHGPAKTAGKATTGRPVLPSDVLFGNHYLKNPVVTLIVLLLLGLTCSSAEAGTLGGEGADLGNPGPTYTISSAGTHTVTGALGPTPGDQQDGFKVTIPASQILTSTSFSGSGTDMYGDPWNYYLSGCGKINQTTFNQTYSSSNSNCTVTFLMSTNIQADSRAWTVSLVTINTPNSNPTDISLSNSSISPAGGVNAVVGTFTTTDPNSGDTHTYSLVSGTGSTDNSLFNISGSTLRANNASSMAEGSYSIRVRTTDQAGGFFEKAFTITLSYYPGVTVSSPADNAYNKITNVTFGSINNDSDAPPDNAPYGDYTGQSTTVTPGSGYTISVSLGGSDVSNSYIKVYVDWNQDYDFADANEGTVVVSDTGVSTSPSNPYTATVNVPTDAVTGNTRMRVMLDWQQVPNANGTIDYGEAEDYTIVVGSACTDPDVPTVTPSPNSVCPGDSSTLSFTGNLNDATAWYAYTGSCGGTAIGSTATNSFVVTPGSPSTTYYIRGEGGCVTPGSCGTATVTASDTTNPSITCPDNQSVNADGSGLFTLPDYTGLATSNDNCTASPTVTQSPVPGTAIGVGTTAITLTATDGSGNTASCNFNVLVSDVTPPVVTSVIVPANATYIAGQNLDFTVNFSENVTVNTAGGTPQLSLTIGATTRQAVYLSGSGSGALVFRYTIEAGELDTDGIAAGTLSANGGTLRDAAGNNADLTLNSVGSTTAVLVDAVLPSVSSVNVPASATYVAGQNLDFIVNFGENITVNTAGGTPQLSLTIGATTRQAVYLSGSGSGALVFRYTIEAGELDTDGIAAGTLSANGAILGDAAGNDADLTLNSVGSTTAVLVDAVLPSVSSVNVPASATYVAGQNLDFIVNFGENITVNTAGGTPQLSLTIGATTRQAVYLSGSGSGALVFRYTIEAGELDTDGIAVGTLSANGGTLRDAAGNNADLTLNSVGSTTAVLVDAVLPSVSSVNVPASATYVAGQNLDFIVNFGENITVNTGGGTPQLSLTIGATTRQAVYLSGSGSGALVFRYTIEAGELDTDGIAAGTLSANGGTLRDAAGNDANLTLNSVGSTAAVLVDAVDPTVTEITPVTTPTNDSTPSVTINTTEAGTLAVGGSCGSASEGAIGSGNQTITLTQSDNATPLAGGTHSDCTVTVTDAAGNANTPVILTSFTVDLQAPTVIEVTPVVTPGNDSTPDVTISTNEAGVLTVGGSCGSSNEGAIASGNTTVTLTRTDNSTALAAGTYSDCTVTVTDAAGNSNSPVTLTSFIIDTQAPTVTNGNINISGATGTGGAFKVGDPIVATWNNTAGGDNNNDISSVTIDFSQFGGGSAVSATNNADTWTATFIITEDGGGIIEASNRNVIVTATDNVGNSTTTADTSNATVDNNSPTVPSLPDMLAASDLGSSSTDNWTLDTTPTFAGTAEIGAIVSLTSNVDGPIGTNGPLASTSWGITSSVLSEGSHNITVTATDAAGNTSASSGPLACLIDATDPVVAVPANIAVNTDPGQPTAVVSWTAPSATDNQDGSLTPVMTTGLASGSAFPVGLTTETFTATDTAGNSASSSFTITVGDNEAPVINGMPTDMNITIPQSTISAVPVSWTEPTAMDVVDGVIVPVQTAGITNGGDFPLGDTIVTYTATDFQGNSKSASFTVTVVRKSLLWLVIPGLISPNKISSGSE